MDKDNAQGEILANMIYYQLLLLNIWLASLRNEFVE